MMDSPVKRAFDFASQEKPATLAAYEPRVDKADLLDKSYYYGKRFGHGLLLARRMVEAGARFVQVEYQYGPFKGFDTHENGQTRMAEMKKQIDGPIAQLVRDLADRGLLERTLVVVATEFGRTIANQPKAGIEPVGFAESQTGDELIIEDQKMYGFHGHFSSANAMLFFGGGFKRGFVHGRTAERHPMVSIENPVSLIDVHATIYKALGISADTNYVTEGRPFYVTKDGKGRPIEALLA
jgi:arylsulfatase A-like enzyme